MSMIESLAGGRYRLGQLIGRGGMAEVHVATDTRLGRTVAIKIMRPDLATDKTFLERFRREAHSVAQMNQPNIVSIYDSGEEVIESADGQVERLPYLVMEYVKGQTLRDIIKANGPLTQRDAAQVMEGVLRALEYSHRRGIIHRDIKPGNIMISEAGEVKVMDFGIARVMDDSAATMTQSQGVVGTAQYLSPEQARGESVDMRSDLYSAGCVLYEMLTGRPPFTGDSAVAIAYQHVSEVATPPSVLVPGLPKMWDSICAKAMAKDRQNRYATAAEFLRDILTFMNGGRPMAAGFDPLTDLATGKTKPLPGGPAPSGPPTLPFEPVEPVAPKGDDGDAGQITRKKKREEARRKKKRMIILASVLGALAVVAAAVGLWFAFAHSAATAMATVPTITNTMTEAQAEQKITAAGFRFVKEIDHDSTLEKGMFTGRQAPKGGAQAPKGSAVRVWFSNGPQNAKIPDVTGDTQDEAREALQAAGFKVMTSVSMENSATIPRDHVTRTNPAAGMSLAKGSQVQLYVSNGMTSLPDVVGKSQDEAQQMLGAFHVTVFNEASDTVPAGQVTRMNPGGNSTVAQGADVQIWVSTGKEQVTVPQCSASDTFSTCKARLEGAGLVAGGTDQGGAWQSMDPAAGTQVDKGSTVTITTAPAEQEKPNGDTGTGDQTGANPGQSGQQSGNSGTGSQRSTGSQR